MRFDIEHLKHLAEKLDYKPDSQQHKDNLAEYCNSDRMIAFAEAFRALEQRAEAAERERDEAVKLRLEVSGSLSSATIRYETAEAKLAELDKQEPVVWCNENDLKLMVNKRMIGGMMTVRHHGERPLFTRPAAAINLADLLPDEMTSKQASRSYGGEVAGYRDGFNACIAAILRNIE